MFAINAVSFVAVVAALVAWKRPPSTVVATREPFSQSVVGAFGRPRQQARSPNPVAGSPIGFPVSALWALLPLAASQHRHLRRSATVRVGNGGSGGRARVLVMSRLRAACGQHTARDCGVGRRRGAACGSYLPLAAGVVELLLSGVAWIATLTTLTLAAQLSLPSGCARGLAMYLVVLMAPRRSERWCGG